MPRLKFQTLTEQMFYTLLCLKEECYGMDILDRVPAMTGGRVSVGSGTLYTLLEQFLEAGMIEETKVEGRRRSYILTKKGKDMLEREYRRIRAQAADYRRIFGESDSQEDHVGADRGKWTEENISGCGGSQSDSGGKNMGVQI